MKDQLVLPKIRELLDNKEFTSGLEQIIEKQLYDRKNVISIDKSAKNPPIIQNGNKLSTNNISISKKNGKPQNSNNTVDISDDSPG